MHYGIGHMVLPPRWRTPLVWRTPQGWRPPRIETPLGWGTPPPPRMENPPGWRNPPQGGEPPHGQCAGGTHPTGMHSCCFNVENWHTFLLWERIQKQAGGGKKHGT